jgi:hypothetical protein
MGVPETGPSLLLRGPKLGPCKGAQSNAGTLLRHVKRLLRCAQGQFTLGAGLHSHSSGLLTHGSGLRTEVAFGMVIFGDCLSGYLYRNVMVIRAPEWGPSTSELLHS